MAQIFTLLYFSHFIIYKLILEVSLKTRFIPLKKINILEYYFLEIYMYILNIWWCIFKKLKINIFRILNKIVYLTNINIKNLKLKQKINEFKFYLTNINIKNLKLKQKINEFKFYLTNINIKNLKLKQKINKFKFYLTNLKDYLKKLVKTKKNGRKSNGK